MGLYMVDFVKIQTDFESGLFYQKDILVKYNISIKRLRTFVKRGLLNKEKWKLKKYEVKKETKKLISEGRKKWLSENSSKHPWLLKSKSKPCEVFKDFLRENKVDFFEEVMISKDRFYSVDILLPDFGSIIEINGNQHYNEFGDLKPYYKDRNEYIERIGWKVYEIHYSIVYKIDLCLIILENIRLNNKIDIPFYIKRKKEKKFKDRQDYWDNRRKKKREKYFDKLKDLKNSNIDFKKFGWVKEASIILGVKNPGKLLKEIDPDFYKDCYVRNKFSCSSVG